MRKTNACEICGKRYKYPTCIEVHPIRYKICYTCESQFTVLDIYCKASIQFSLGQSKRAPKDLVSLLEYFNKYKAIKKIYNF